MKTDSPFTKRLVGICIAAVLIATVVFFVFRSEAMEGISDGLTNNAFARKATVSDEQLTRAPAFKLHPERNDIEFVQISKLTTGAPTVAGTPIAFTLTNQGDSNAFPSVKVILVDRSGRAVREQIFSERDYVHPGRFEENEIELLLSLRPGETGFTAKPFYPEAK